MLMLHYCATALFLFVISGCTVATLQASKTEATLEFADGRIFRYSSDKEHSGIDVSIKEIDTRTGKVIKEWKLKIQKSGTPEAAYAAMVQQQTAMTKQNEAVTKLVQSVLERMIAGAPVPGR